jgi:hypothetical protein
VNGKDWILTFMHPQSERKKEEKKRKESKERNERELKLEKWALSALEQRRLRENDCFYFFKLV